MQFLWLASSVGFYCVVGHGQREQAQRVEQMEQALVSLHAAVSARAGREESAGLARPLAETVERRLSEQEVEAIAARVALLTHQQGERIVAPAREPEVKSPAPPDLEQQESLARATTRVERLLVNGRMTVEDVEELRREMMPILSRPEAQALRQRLIVAVNQDRLRPPEAPGMWLP
jgi:hypothetical protein